MSDGISRMYEEMNELRSLQDRTLDYTNQEKSKHKEIERLKLLVIEQKKNRELSGLRESTKSGFRCNVVNVENVEQLIFSGPGIPYYLNGGSIESVQVKSANNILEMLERAFQAGKDEAKKEIRKALGINK